MDTLGFPSPLPTASEPENASAWPPDATPGNASVAPGAGGLAVRGVLIPLVYLVVCVVGLLGNSLVIYVVLRHTASPSVTNVYILNLALADELFMLGLPFLAAQNALSYWPFGSLMCRLVMAVDGINQFTSIFCLTVMSVDRYLAVVHPARSARWRTAPVARAVSAAVWVASAVVVLPVVVFSGVPRGMSTCHMQWPEPAAAWRAGFIIYTAALGFFGPLLVICLCYLLIVVKMRSAGRRVWAPSSQRRRRSERRVTRMVVAVVALFVLCWMPFYVLNIVNVVCPLPEEPALFGLYFLVVALPYANSCANPILYGFLSYRFKQGFRRALLRPSRRVRSQEPPAGPPERTEEEEEEEEEEDEEEGEEGDLLDCGLRLKKVSFAERGVRRHRPGPSPEAQLEEGSPTMVEKGLEPGVLTLAEEEDEVEGAPGSPEREPPAVLLRRAGGEGRAQGPDGGPEPETGSGSVAQKQRRQNRSSWIDPPEEEHSPQLTQAELESCMKKYEDTFQDYQEMFVQFGYVVLFSSAFPLAALCALVNNLIEIRSDALKLCTGLQRPFGQRVESIGQWQKVMEAMGVLAIIVNCYLIGQCGQLQRLFPWLSPEAAIVSVVVLEHFALLLKYLIHVAIPDIPGWVAEEMAKLEYQRREAFKRHERQAQHRYQQQQRKRREEEERQRHTEHHTRRERDSSSREETRAEGSGQDPAAPEKASAKAKGSGVGGHGSERPKRPGSLLAPNNVMKLKQIIPLQGKFLSSGATSSIAGAGPGPATRPTPAQSPTGSDTRLPAFLKFLKSPETRRDPERSHSPPKAFHASKLFPFGGGARAEAGANGVGGQVRLEGTPGSGGGGGGGRAQRCGSADEAAAEEPDVLRPEEEGSGTALAPVGTAALRTRSSRSPVPSTPTLLPRPPTPPASCWQWDGPWGCGGEGTAPRQAPATNAECPPCAPPAPQPLPGDTSFYSLAPLPLPPPSQPPESPSASPSPQAVCWPSGWH